MTGCSSPPNEELRSIPGGRRPEVSFGGIRIVAAAADDPPFEVDAVVAEEDTWLALSADATVVRPPGHPVRVMTQVWDAEPARPGSVTIQPGVPTDLLAIVHDLNAEPSLRDEWVEAALSEVFSALATRCLASVALPLVGTKHGCLHESKFMELLRGALESHVRQRAELESEAFPVRIWLVCDSPQRRELVGRLAP